MAVVVGRNRRIPAYLRMLLGDQLDFAVLGGKA